MAKTVIGSFDSYAEAQSVVDELAQQGFDRDDISIIAKDREPGAKRADSERTDTGGSEVGSGAAKGALAGGAIGLAAGLVAIAIPGIGPVIAAGPLATALAGAGIGAAAGGIIGALMNVGVNPEDAEYYAESVRRGGALVLVHAEEADAQRAADIMQLHGATDIDRRAEEWRQTGWQGFDPNAEPYDEVIPVVEEELRVGKREVERGRARVYTHVVEQPVQAQVQLQEEEVSVTRRPVDRPATERDLEAARDRSMEFTERGEEAVVEKKARVVEEVEISKDTRQRTERIDDSVRRTEVDVDEDLRHEQPAQPQRSHPDKPLHR